MHSLDHKDMLHFLNSSIISLSIPINSMSYVQGCHSHVGNVGCSRSEQAKRGNFKGLQRFARAVQKFWNHCDETRRPMHKESSIITTTNRTSSVKSIVTIWLPHCLSSSLPFSRAELQRSAMVKGITACGYCRRTSVMKQNKLNNHNEKHPANVKYKCASIDIWGGN